MATKEPIGGTLAIEVQLKKEATDALRHAGLALEKAIAALASARSAYCERSPGADAGALAKRYRDARAHADYRRWCMVVQREAMGLMHHEELDHAYPFPPPVPDLPPPT